MCQDDYDSPWKEALAKYLPSFFEFFFPHIFEDVDWTQEPVFKDTELSAIAPTNQEQKRGGPRVVDTLVELHRVSGEVTRVLVHIEIQAQRKADFERRLFLYYSRIMERYAQPLCSLVILADKSSKWRPAHFCQDLWGTEVDFKYPVIKLADFRPRIKELERSKNPFAQVTAATLHAQRTRPNSKMRVAAKIRMYREIRRTGLDEGEVRAFFRLIDWILGLSTKMKDVFYVELRRMEKETGMPFVSSLERMGLEKGMEKGLKQGLEKGLEKGLEQGLEKGLQQGRREAIVDILEARFGQVPDPIRSELEKLSKPERLRELGRTAVTVENLEVFQQHLGGA